MGGQLFGHRLGKGPAIRCASSPTDFVENDQTPLGGMFQDVRRLHHLDHKSREPLRQEIGRANPGENTVYGPNPCGPGGNETPHLGQQHEQSGLTRIGAFSRGIGTGNDQDVPACIQSKVVRHEWRGARVKDWVPALCYEQLVRVSDLRPNPTLLGG